MGHVIAALVGIVMIALWIVAWRPSTYSSWSGTDNQERFVLVGLPLLGTGLVLIGIQPVVPDGVGTAAAGVAVLLFLGAVLWGAIGLPLPSWAVPDVVERLRAGRRATERARRDRRRATRRARKDG